MIAFLLFLVSAFISGGVNFTLVKLGVSEISPLTFIFSRFSIAAFITFLLWIRKKEVVKGKDLIKVFPFTINVILFSYGLAHTTVLAGGLITLIIPILVAILGYFILKEALLQNHVVGLALALIGVLFLLFESFEKQNSLSLGEPLGNIIIVISSTAFAFYTIGVRKISHKYSQITILFFTFLMVAVTSGILAPFEWINKSFIPAHVSWIGWTSVIILALVAVVFYFMYQWIIKNISAFVASLIIYGGLIFTSLSGTLLFHESLTLKFVLGSIFILAGVFYATTYVHIKKRMLK